MKSRLLILSVFIFGHILCFAQDKTQLIDTLFKSRIVHFETIPNTFKFYYRPSVSMDNKLIIDTLKFFASNMLQATEIYYIEFLGDAYRFLKRGVLWTKYDTIGYNWNNYDKSLKIVKNIKFNRDSSPRDDVFYKDVEEWNEFVTDRSYWATSIAGSSFIYCSKIIIKENNIKIEHTAFRQYDKDNHMYYLKEQQIDNFKTSVKINCQFYEKHGYEINWDYFKYYKSRGPKVFDCDGKEIDFESITIEK